MYLIKFSKNADKDKKLLKSAGLEKKAKPFPAKNKNYWLVSLSGFEDFPVEKNTERITLEEIYEIKYF